MPKEGDEDKLGSIDRSLREILKWTRFANTSKLKEMLESTLDTVEKKIAFEGSDGVNMLKEVAAACDTPQDTVYGWWQKWSRLGLVMESETRKGRMMKIVSLDDVGVKVPKIQKKSKPQDNQAAPSTASTQTQEGVAGEVSRQEKSA